MARWVLHVDLDQFLAAVEVLRRPELAGLPVVVGGDGDPTKRGVVSTASYEARRYGMHSGLALRAAARRCPHAVFPPVDRPVYEAASEEVMQTLKQFDAVVVVAGWDHLSALGKQGWKESNLQPPGVGDRGAATSSSLGGRRSSRPSAVAENIA